LTVPPGTGGFLEEAAEGWISPLATSIASAGVGPKQARVRLLEQAAANGS
jgi:hypothetical protein